MQEIPTGLPDRRYMASYLGLGMQMDAQNA